MGLNNCKDGCMMDTSDSFEKLKEELSLSDEQLIIEKDILN